MKRPTGSRQLYEKWGSYYGRWRTPDGRRLNCKLGPVRTRGESDGLTRAQAEQAFRRVRAEATSRKPVEPVVEILTVDQVADRLRERIAIEGVAHGGHSETSGKPATATASALPRRSTSSPSGSG
jgi:hypothetical protein